MSDQEESAQERIRNLFAGYRDAQRASAETEAAVQDATGFNGRVYLDPSVPDGTGYIVTNGLFNPEPQTNMALLESGPPDAGDLKTLRREHDVVYLDGEKIGMIWKPGWAERLVEAIKKVELHPEEIGDDIVVIFEDEPRLSMSVPVTLGEDGDQRVVIPEGSLVPPPTYPAAVQRGWLEDDLHEVWSFDGSMTPQDVAECLIKNGWRR